MEKQDKIKHPRDLVPGIHYNQVTWNSFSCRVEVIMRGGLRGSADYSYDAIINVSVDFHEIEGIYMYIFQHCAGKPFFDIDSWEPDETDPWGEFTSVIMELM